MLLALFAGCIIVTDTEKPRGGGTEPGCDMMAVGSVTVRVADPEGTPVRRATVEWRRDGREYAPCDGMPAPGEWVCGWEEAGDITVRVSAEGYATVERTVTVPQGECHVEPQLLEVRLEPEGTDCTEELRASVVASLVSSTGEAMRAPEVWWEVPGSERPAEPCEPTAEGTWTCGWEVSGVLRVSGTAAGFSSSTVDVEVEADECHVITEYVTLVVDPDAT